MTDDKISGEGTDHAGDSLRNIGQEQGNPKPEDFYSGVEERLSHEITAVKVEEMRLLELQRLRQLRLQAVDESIARSFLHTEIKGEENRTYLSTLSHALNTLSEGLKAELDPSQMKMLVDFGKSHDWDLKRLPKRMDTYKTIAEFTRIIHDRYMMLGWHDSMPDPCDNRGYFDALGVSKLTGLPVQFDMIELERLKSESASILERMPDYDDISDSITHTLLTDITPASAVTDRIAGMRKDAMKKNFLERLAETELIPIGNLSNGPFLYLKKVASFGGESQWNISYPIYSPISGMFHVYVVDVWQDVRKPHITQGPDRKYLLTPELARGLNFNEENNVSFLIESLDMEFESLHPIHITRATIGPFENKYLTKSTREGVPFGITKKLLKKNPDFWLLRANVEYSFAPNYVEHPDGRVRQVVYDEKWCDEIIVCPVEHSETISRSITGPRIRIFEA